MKEKNVFKGAAVLTIASLLVKVLSASYRIPYQNMVGDVGFYVYQQVYPFFGIGMSIATFGFPVVLSKLVAEKIGQGKEEEIPGMMRIAFMYLSFVGLLLFCLLFFGAHHIAVFMGDENLARLISTISFGFLIMPLTSLLRGYFQGKLQMIPTALSQLTEQAVRVGVILVLSLLLLQQGYDMYKVGSGAMLGAVLGGIVGLGTLCLFLNREHLSYLLAKGKSVNKAEVVKALFIQGIAICVCNMVLVLIQFVDSFSFYSLLVGSGYSEVAAKAAKGVYDRGLPIIQLGVVVATSISLAVLPSMTAANETGNIEEVKKYINIVSKYCCIIALGATVGLMMLARPINIMFFKNDAGTDTLEILAATIFLSAIIITSASILQALGEVLAPGFYILLGMIVKAIGNIILIPLYQANGAAIATILALVVVAVCNGITLYKKKGHVFLAGSKIDKMVYASVIMAFVLWLYQYITGFGNTRSGQTFLALSAVLIGGVTYIGALFRFRVLTKQDWAIFMKKEKVQMKRRI